jgi:hypothetical protein
MPRLTLVKVLDAFRQYVEETDAKIEKLEQTVREHDLEIYSQSKKFWRDQAIEKDKRVKELENPNPCSICGKSLYKYNPSCPVAHLEELK